jgi:hypothetical protein
MFGLWTFSHTITLAVVAALAGMIKASRTAETQNSLPLWWGHIRQSVKAVLPHKRSIKMDCIEKVELDEELGCLIGLEDTAMWRRMKARQFPEDTRNEQAADLLDRLAKEIEALEGSDVHLRIVRKQREFCDIEHTDPLTDPYARMRALISTELRDIGFRSKPKTCRQLLEDIADQIEEIEISEDLNA